jgi:hypothetical protein
MLRLGFPVRHAPVRRFSPNRAREAFAPVSTGDEPGRVRMDIAERLPTLTDQQLTVMRSNAERLGRAGTNKQQGEAKRLLPLIQAEIDGRKARAPAPAKPARRTKKA